MAKSTVEIKNRKASFEFSLLDTFTCGIMLMGSEIKSIRAGKASITEAFCTFQGDRFIVRNMQVEPWGSNPHYVHEPKRDRNLLLKATELAKIQRKLKDQGITVVPLRIFIADSGYAKLEVALAKGKKTFDKRASLKEKDVKRDLDRAM